ncbi:fibronectin type-III domain-containing protein [Trichonephila clavipes]|nr:fibronectin type-III domain-containing protein [Trichonephila clavipes]
MNRNSYANDNHSTSPHVPTTRTATAGSDVVQSGRPIFDDFFQHLWPYIGNNTANVVLQMVEQPAEISVDSVEALDSRTALLRWSLEYKGNLPIKRYHLQMKNYSTGGADWLDMDDKIPANATSYTVRYLAPAVTYGFQLAAVNEAGHSNWEAKNLTMPADEIIQPYTTTRRPQTYNTFCGTAQHSVEQFKQQRWGITAGVVLPAREISDLDRGYHSPEIVLNSDNLGGAIIDPRWNMTKAELETIKGPSVSIANPERPDSFIIRPFPSLRRSLYFERDF